MTQNLMMKIVEIPCGNGGWLMISGLASVLYLEDAEIVQIQLTPEFGPYFLHLKSHWNLNKVKFS